MQIGRVSARLFCTRVDDLNLHAIKSSLRNIRWIYAINVWWKVRKGKGIYSNTVRYYTEKSSVASFKSLLAERFGARLASFKEKNKDLNIFYLGTDELQDKGGILQSLERLGNLSYFTRAGGGYGQNTAGAAGQRRKVNADRLLSLFRMLHGQGRTPDILIAQTFASHIDPKVFSQIRDTYGTLVVNIAMDDRHQYWGEYKVSGEWGGTYGLIPHIDLALTAAPECVGWYLKEGCPAIFFPEASDPEIFHPMPDLQKIHDVSFVGRRYGIREKIVLALRRAGIQVTAYGDGWENGYIEVEEVPKLFAQSRIVLGIGTIGHSADFYALKMRDFDGPMSGSCYVTHDNADLSEVYDVGKEIVTYRTIDECIEKVSFYLKHETEREEIANAGYKRAMTEHTWDKRFGEIVSLLGSEAINSIPHNSKRPQG